MDKHVNSRTNSETDQAHEYYFSAQPEEEIAIPIPGTSLHINAVLRGGWDQPLAILVHGLGCDNRGLLPFLLARTLSEKGLSSLRVNMYDTAPDTRDMIDCTVATHAKDFETIVSYVRKHHAPKVFAVGHSYGGLTILSSQAPLDAAVLLEPSHFKCSFEFDALLHKDRHEITDKAMVYENGIGRLDPLPMIAERKQKMNMPEADLAQKPYPLLFVAAEKCMLLPYVKKYFAIANVPKKLVIVQAASHSLTDTDEIMLQVFSETTRWLAEYSQA